MANLININDAFTATTAVDLNTNHDIFEYLDNKSYTLDGISGRFQHCARTLIGGHIAHTLHHEPDAIGKLSEEYMTIKRELKDDWSTDITQDIEHYCSIAIELGFDADSE